MFRDSPWRGATPAVAAAAVAAPLSKAAAAPAAPQADRGFGKVPFLLLMGLWFIPCQDMGIL